MLLPPAAYAGREGFFMGRKAAAILAALALTAGLALALFRMGRQEGETNAPLRLVRVWVRAQDGDVAAWLRGRASAYEKQTACRVYLRAASPEEMQAALAGESEAMIPDLMFLPGAGKTVAFRGYALILRDGDAPALTPAPTAALFARPSPAPGPSPAPAPLPDAGVLTAVLTPRELTGVLSGSMASAHPDLELSQGKARAAVLTAEQAAALAFGWRAFPLPEGGGLLSVGGQGFSQAGGDFLAFLLSPSSQSALKAQGLYSVSMTLYGPEDPLRSMIQGSAAAEEASCSSSEI